MCIMLLTLELLNIISQNIALFTDPTSIIPAWYHISNTNYRSGKTSNCASLIAIYHTPSPSHLFSGSDRLVRLHSQSISNPFGRQNPPRPKPSKPDLFRFPTLVRPLPHPPEQGLPPKKTTMLLTRCLHRCSSSVLPPVVSRDLSRVIHKTNAMPTHRRYFL